MFTEQEREKCTISLKKTGKVVFAAGLPNLSAFHQCFYKYTIIQMFIVGRIFFFFLKKSFMQRLHLFKQNTIITVILWIIVIMITN